MRVLYAALLLAAICFQANAQPGVIDSTFNPMDGGFGSGDGANAYVFSSAIQSDGKIIIVGCFTSYNGSSTNYIARLDTDGKLDTSFKLGTGANDTVYAVAIQSDGKIIIGGCFQKYNGTPRNRIARLNTDGSLDTVFNPGNGANDTIYTIGIQSDGKIIIGGGFSNFNMIPRNRIARLNSDGTLDAGFNPGIGANGFIYTTSIQSDDKIIIGGSFTSYNGSPKNRIARLNADGSLDVSFNPGSGADWTVHSTAMQSNGKIIIGGDFTWFNGNWRKGIARLNLDGTTDLSFYPGGGASSIQTTAIQSDGKIIIGGGFSSYNGIFRGGIARINTDGSLDASFNPGSGANFTINSTAIQSDGKIIIVGCFSSYDGNTRKRITRINANGTLDVTFNPGTGANNSVYAIAIQSDGKIIIGGGFTSYNGSTRNRIARINADGTFDASFNTGSGADWDVYSTTIQSDGKIIIGGWFTYYNGTIIRNIARLNTDGTLDAGFYTGSGANGSVYTTAIQNDGKIIIGGSFTSFNGSPRKFIARLNTDGTLDGTFNPNFGLDGLYVNKIAIQSDGKIVVVGWLHYNNGTFVSSIVRLNTNGTLDVGFNPGSGANGTIYTTSIQSDGKIIIGGSFQSYNVIPRKGVARLNTDGTLDNTFDPAIGLYNTFQASTIQRDGKIIIAGFLYLNPNNKYYLVARLNTDGTLDTAFNNSMTNDGVRTTVLQSDGKIIIGGDFTSYNGTGRNRIARLIGDPVGINIIKPKGNEISIFPNPVSDELNIEIEGTTGQVSFEIINLYGQVVFKGSFIEKTTVQTAALVPGVYLVKVGNDKGFETIKIVKQK